MSPKIKSKKKQAKRKRTVKPVVVDIDKTLRIAREAAFIQMDIQQPSSPEEAVIMTVGVFLGVFGAAKGLDFKTPPAQAWLLETWGKDIQHLRDWQIKMSDEIRTMVEASVNAGISLEAVADDIAKRSTLSAEYRQLQIEAAQLCRCDGGNTAGCSACVAERKLRQFGNQKSTSSTETAGQ